MTTEKSDVRACAWWRPLNVVFVGEDQASPQMADFRSQLRESFREQGHSIVTTRESDIDLLIDTMVIPDGPEPLTSRMPERSQPLMLSVVKDYALARRPQNLVVLVGVKELLGGWPHADVVSTARIVMARIGAPKIVFVSGPGPSEITYCTLEGGHPSETQEKVSGLRDRLVASACAREVGGRFDIKDDAISQAQWNETRVPDAVVNAGRRMHALGLLPPPHRISNYVSPRMARVYERYLGLNGFSEGMLFAVDPLTSTTMVTASGSWEVDKRALRRDEVTPVAGTIDGRVQVQAPHGVRPKGPSVEAAEVLALLEAAPRVQLMRNDAKGWELNANGAFDVPIIRAGIHVHVGVSFADDAIIETIEPDRKMFPYGFGCGTDLMCEVARHTVERSSAINDPTDPRLYVRWPMLYHGEMVIELWKAGMRSVEFDGLLDLFGDNASGPIRFSPDHVDQPR